MSCLLTVLGNRIELEHNRRYLLGRAADCDLVVEDLAASRRHALLHVGASLQVIHVEDRNSHNGTFVNEERVSDRTRLRHGDRIRIGATVYLVSLTDEVDAGIPALLDTGTLTLERSSVAMDDDEKLRHLVKSLGGLTTEFAGQINRCSFVQVLQVLVQTHRSGTLHVVVAGGAAAVELRCGEIYGASFQELDNFAALLQLAEQKTGIFWLEEDTAPCVRRIEQPASHLLLELCRALDEKSAV